MTGPKEPHRRPRVFEAGDPHLSVTPQADPAPADESAEQSDEPPRNARGRVSFPTAAGVSKGVRFGALFLSAMLGLATLAASVSFFRFVSVALERDDWIGWTSVGLLALAALSGLIILLREVLGLFALHRLGRLRRDMDAALEARDAKAERDGLARLKALYAARANMTWPLARLAEHERDIHDPGRLLALADRELMAPIDAQARALVLRSAKRVSTVTAMSPLALVSVGYVLVENVSLLRQLAALYGGRPGVLGSLRLARLVVSHIVGTGGVALTDDLLGQFFGQDILRRLSRRLGEGAFNGALTVRLGAAALDVIRPLPFIEAPPIRARDIVKELFVATSDPAKGGQA
jgi:putative membrane protein